ncbi:hypothetical protein CVT24_002959 [Panaeolus cyanescens]|uniref:DUF3074 domain-containing protein n=1 Tax=Panaeolus cyanescens TaxID=181874 RepID=A0A409VPF3_9AGAR|nr:hypothetical protein CVT24_002959 [Panaeolus cyanescens]
MSDQSVFTLPPIFSLRPIKPNDIPSERDLIRSAQLLLQESKNWPESKMKPTDASKSTPAIIQTFCSAEQKSTETTGGSKSPPWNGVVVTLDKDDLSFTSLWSRVGSHPVKSQQRMIISIPIDLSKDQLLAELEEKGVKGKCATVEMIQELEGDKVEWRRLTCISPGGLLPRLFDEKLARGRLVEVSPD